MIGKILFTLAGEELEAVLGDDGYWTCPNRTVEFDLNTDLSCDSYSPADGRRGYLQLREAAERWNGRVEAPDPPNPTPGRIY